MKASAAELLTGDEVAAAAAALEKSRSERYRAIWFTEAASDDHSRTDPVRIDSD